tara:strand:- start:536 stop:724 length:189 start_codon:yes stop_codon:yes gene_type:complete
MGITYPLIVTLIYQTSEMNNELTKEQTDAIEGMIKRRMDNAGETRAEASDFIVNYLQERFTK